MLKVFNPTNMLVTLQIENLTTKETDGIHVQPLGRVTLPDGFVVNQNSLSQAPGVTVTDTTPKTTKTR